MRHTNRRNVLPLIGAAATLGMCHSSWTARALTSTLPSSCGSRASGLSAPYPYLRSKYSPA